MALPDLSSHKLLTAIKKKYYLKGYTIKPGTLEFGTMEYRTPSKQQNTN